MYSKPFRFIHMWLALDFLLMLTRKGVLENCTAKNMLTLLPWVLLMRLINTSDSISFFVFKIFVN